MENLKVALVHDWLTGMRGGEKVLEVLCELFPSASLYTLVYNPGSVSSTIEGMKIHTSYLDRMPFKESRYRSFLPLMPSAVESFDLSGFDLVISTSHAVAKGAIPPPQALHVCYCHTPMRYIWDQYGAYFGPGRANLGARMAMLMFRPYLRSWDVRTSARVHHFVANSENVAQRIRRLYGRDSEVIHAPVDVSRFMATGAKGDHYLVVSALVPYKRVDIAVDAFRVGTKKLLVVGNGPERDHLANRASANVEFLGWMPDEALARLYAQCRAVIFPGLEDFGIVPLEAMASGKGVIAFGEGGVMETVVGSGRNRTGVFFRRQTVADLRNAIDEFERIHLDPVRIRKHAEKFDRGIFRKKIQGLLERKIDEHLGLRVEKR